jgi:hypothetical protein
LYKLIYLARRNPTVTREDWPKTWKSHATFAGKLMTAEVQITSMSYNNRIDNPTIDGRAVDIPGLSDAHDGVAVACSASLADVKGGKFTPEERALIDKDELRVFDMLTPEFSFYCAETALRDGDMGNAALFRFLIRKPDISRADFEARFAGAHADRVRDVIAPLSTVSRYLHNRLIEDAPPLFPFDAISECRFTTAEDAVRAAAGPDLAGITKDLAAFCDMDRSIALLTSVVRRYPRAPQETA